MVETLFRINLYLLFCISFLPQHIFLPSITTTADYFGSNYSTMQFAISAFMAGGAFLQIIIGPLSDRFGRRPILLICLVFFILTTIGCIISSEAYSFLICRTLQAISIAGLVIGRAIVADTQEQKKVLQTMANLAVIMAGITIAGPILGELMDSNYGWKSSFYLLLLMGVILLFVNLAFLPETNSRKINNFWDQISQYRLLIRVKLFWGYVLSGNFATASFFSLLVATPYIIQKIFYLDSSWIGVMIGIIVIGFILGNIISVKFSKYLSEFSWLLSGYTSLLFSILLSLLLHKLFPNFPPALFAPFFFIGIGNGFIWPISIAGAISINQNLRGSASGLHGASMYFFGAVFSSVTGIMISIAENTWPLFLLLSTSSLIGIFVLFTLYAQNKKN